MKFTELSASDFGYIGIFYDAEFKDILSKIVACYTLMLEDGVRLPNNENGIRDVLLISYLKNTEVRKKVGLIDLYSFNREVPEDNNVGRTDIKVETLDTLRDQAAYYTIECKRLNTTNLRGITGLNAEYIKNGIGRYVSNAYLSHYKTNGMIGFVVAQMAIDENIGHINHLIANSFQQLANTVVAITKFNLTPGFEYSYTSKHKTDNSEIVIYHLMLDFSGNMQ